LKNYLLHVLGYAGLLLVCGSQVRAQTVTLSSLLSPGATITSGDKVFSDFSYIVNTVASPDMPTAAQVFVTPEIVAGNYGLLFNALWHANPGNGNETALLSYTVTITAPNTLRDRSYCVRYPDRSDEPGPEDSAVGTGSAFARSILNRS